MGRFSNLKKHKAGSMDKSLVLKQWVATTDEGGGQNGSYVQVIEGVIASVKPIGANERWKLGQMQQSATHTIVMRYCPEQKPGMVWVMEGRLFRILGIADVDDMQEIHQVTCEELTPKDR